MANNSLFANQNPEMIFPSELGDFINGQGGMNNMAVPMPMVSETGFLNPTENPQVHSMIAGPSTAVISPPATKKQRRSQHADGHQDTNMQTLFQIVRNGRQALQCVVDDWIETYKQDKDSALLDLINFLIHACGCKGTVTPEMFISLDQTEIIQRMTEEFDEDSGEYPLIQSGPTWKKFKSNFTEFIVVLVRQCQSSLIFDQYLFENVIGLLTGLCDSQVRAFRHTSTLAAMKLMTAFVTVAASLNVQHDKISRQFEAEKAKNAARRASQRMDLLRAKNEEFEEHIKEVQTMMGNIFNGIFVHRYRDTHPEIRAICMGEIGTWIKNYPTMFLDDGYLRYIGWNLHDKHWDVRLRCVHALSNLYTSEEFASSLELFTNRFKDRIVAMTLDKKIDVSVQAIKLVTSINVWKDDALDSTDCEAVYQLVFSSNRSVAQAAAQFLIQRLLTREEDEQSQQNKNMQKKKGKNLSPNIGSMRDLVQYFIESELHDHAAYLIDSLWDSTSLVKDWDCMTQMLLDDISSGYEPLNDKEETYLIDIMTCCARQASDGQPPVGRAQPKKLTGKERQIVQDDKNRLTNHFIQTLPRLLSKHGIDPEKVADLVVIPQYFDLDMYTSGRLEQYLDQLLKLLTEIVTKHADKQILHNCSKTFEFLCNDTYAISNKCKTARSALIDNLAQTFQAAWQDYLENVNDLSETEIYNLTAAMRRISAFYCSHNLNAWEMFDSLYKIAKSYSDNVPVKSPIVCDALASLQFSLMWSRADIDDQNPDKNELKTVKRRLNEVMSLSFELMCYSQNATEVIEDAYTNICDLLIVYGKQIGFNKALKPLVYLANESVQEELKKFNEVHVFTNEDEDVMAGLDDEDDDPSVKIEALHKRRKLLACFCKLIISNNIQMNFAADVFKHYLKFYNDYGDIIKNTLAKLNDYNRTECAKIILRSLHILWDTVPHISPTRVDKACEQFAHIKDLAKNFSFIFSLDQIKSREAIQALHKEGIFYASQPDSGSPNIPPANIDFLEIVNEFTSKMMKQDKKIVLEYLDQVFPPNTIMSKFFLHFGKVFLIGLEQSLKQLL